MVPSPESGESASTSLFPQMFPSASNLTTALENVESAPPSPDLQWDTVSLDGYNFDAFEYPEWVNDLPSDDNIDQWFEENAGPEVIRPETMRVPSLINPGESVTINPTQGQVDSYNDYVGRRNEASKFLKNQLEELEGLQELERQHQDALRSSASRLFRELKPESIQRFVETGDGSFLTENDLRDVREGGGYNIPGVGQSDRFAASVDDLFGGEGMFPSADQLNEMIDERIAADPRYAEANEEQLKAARAVEFRNLLSLKYKDLAVDGVLDNPEMASKFEAQVYEDMNTDPQLYDRVKEMGLGAQALLPNIDYNKDFVGEVRENDMLLTFTDIGMTRLEKGLSNAFDHYNYLTGAGSSDRVMTPYGFSVGISYTSEEKKQVLEEAVDRNIEYDRLIEEAKAKQNVYAQTRDTIKALGDLSGYTAEDLSMMSAEAIDAAHVASHDANTSFDIIDNLNFIGINAPNSQEFRAGLESAPLSLASMGIGYVLARGNAPLAAIISGGIMSSSVGFEDFISTSSPRLSPHLFDENGNSLLTDTERSWRSWRMGLAEGVPEGISNYLSFKLFKVLGVGKFSPYDVFGKKAMEYMGKMFGGIGLAYGANYAEEFTTEMITEIAQTYEREYTRYLAEGRIDRNQNEFDKWMQFTKMRPMFGDFWNENEGKFFEAGRIGGNMSLIFGTGQITSTYGLAAGERVFASKRFRAKAAEQMMLGTPLEESWTKEETKRAEEISEILSKKTRLEMVNPDSETQALVDELNVLTEKVDVNRRYRGPAFSKLAETDPALFLEALRLDNRRRDLVALAGTYKQGKDGRWRLNGRLVPNPEGTAAFKASQKMSKEQKEQYKREINKIENDLRMMAMLGQGMISEFLGEIGLDQNVSVGRIKASQFQSNWRARSKDYLVVDESTDPNAENDTTLRRLLKNWMPVLGGTTLVVHRSQESLDSVANAPTSQGLYLEMEDGTVELHVLYDKNTSGAEFNYVLAHERGHEMTEPIMENPELRRKLYEEVLAADPDLANRVLAAYITNKGTKKSPVYSVEQGVLEREVIVNYLDQVVRGNAKLSALKSLTGRLLIDSEKHAGSLAVVAAKYVKMAKQAGVAVGGTKQSRQTAKSNQELIDQINNMSEAEFEAAVDRGGQLLASKKINLFRGGTVFFEYSNNIPADERTAAEFKYQTRQREFNDYFHLVNWWRKETGNGARPVVGRMAYMVEGQYVPIRATEKWIKKDKEGRPVYMQGALSYHQRQKLKAIRRSDLVNELARQKSALSQEVREFFDDNFKFKGFSLDYHAFFNPKYGATMRGLVEAKRNMKALADMEYNDSFFESLKKDKFNFIISREQAPQIYNMAEQPEVLPLEDQAEALVNRAEKLGVDAWMFATPGSVVHENQVSDLYGANQEEMDAIKQRIESSEKGGTGFTSVSGNMSGPVLQAIELPAEKLAGAYVVSGSNKSDGADLIVIVDDFGKYAIIQGMEDLKVDFRTVKYDRKRAGTITFKIPQKQFDKDGKLIKRTKKTPTVNHSITLAGGFMGSVESVNRGGQAYGPAHLDEGSADTFAQSAIGALSRRNGFYYVPVALRAEDNSLRSPNTMLEYFEYLAAYVEANPNDKAAIIQVLEKVINDKSYTTSSSIVEGGVKTTDTIKFKFSRKMKGKKFAGLEISAETERLTITDLPAFLKGMSRNKKFATRLGFEGRGSLLTSTIGPVSTATKGYALNKNEFLDMIDEPAFKGLPQGAIVGMYEMRVDEAAMDLDQFDITEEANRSTSLGKFYNAASFPHGSLGLNRVIIPRNTELSGQFQKRVSEDPKNLKEGGQGSVTGRFAGLMSSPVMASRRLPGRIYMEGNSAWEKSAATPYGAMLQAAALKYQDRFSDVLLLQQDVEVFRKSKVPESMDFEMALDVYYGRVRNDLEQLEAVVKDIQKDLRRFDISNKDLSDYLYAKHAIERNADILAKDPTMKDGSGMTDAEAIAIIDRLETSEMMQVADRVYKLVENTRDTMVQGGLESAATVDAWRKRYKFYVPLNGLAVDELSDVTNDYPTGGSGMAVYGPSVKKARGRRSKTEHNLLSNIVMQNAAVKQRARKDKAMLSLYNLVKNNPNEKVWRVIGPKNGMKVRGRTLSAAELKQSTNAVPIRINGEQHFIYFQDASYAMALNGMTIEKLNKINASMAKYIGFLRNSYTVWNPAFFISNFARDFEMAVANAAAEIEREGGILQGYGLDTKTFVKALTKTTFKTMKALVKQSALGFAGAKLDPQTQAYMEEWKAAGGQTGFSYSETLNELVAKLNGLTNKTPTQQKAEKAGEFLSKFYANPVQFFKYVEGLNEAFENSVRLASYIEARKAGMTASRAAQLSKNITVNFNKSGEYTPGINSWFLFFNASVQGSTRLARSLRKNEMYVEQNQGGTTNKWHKRLSTTAKISAGMVLFSAMQTLFNIAMSDEEEDGVSYYDKIPDYRKERNWIIMAGPRDPIYIPLPYGLNIFHNLGMLLAEVGSGHREIGSGAAFLAGALHSSFSPIGFGQYDTVGETVTMALTPTALKPGTETFLFNKTYFGSQVYREQLPFGTEVPEYQLAYRSPDYLIEFARYLNQLSGGTTEVSGDVNINPDPYYYLAQSLTGGAGKFVGDIAELSRGMVAMTRKNIDRAASDRDFIKSLLNVEEDEVIQIRRSDIPLLKLMYGEASRFYDTDLYMKNINELKQAEREMKEGESTDFDVTGVQALRSQAKRTADMLEKIRDLKKKARETEDYVDRQNAIYKLQEAERMEYMLFNATYEELRGQYIN